MKTALTALLTVVITAGAASVAGAQSKYDRDGRYYSSNRSPSAIAERQRHRRTFDENDYYERLSEKIPLGTAAWWRQKQRENPTP